MKKIIVKYLTDNISEEELTELQIWLKDEKNQRVFKKYLEDDYNLNLLLAESKIEIDYQKIKDAISTKKVKVRSLFPTWIRVAAVLVLFLGIGYFYQQSFLNSNNDSQIMVNQVVLKLHDGTVQVLDSENDKKLYDNKGKVVITKVKNKISYSDDAKIDELEYNTLLVPYGRIFEVALADGTNVVLNAGSSLKYPTKFIKGGVRQVFLTGEAYFDVAHDAKHPFIVNAEKLDVQVLGTEFNVSAYENDLNTEVVLVKGKVALNDNKDVKKENTVVILPGTKGTYNRLTNTIVTSSVDTSLYTAWMNGELVFRNSKFSDIRKILERRYNVIIINNNKKLDQEVFNARFKNQTIESVLSYLGDSYPVNYQISKGKITIN